MCHMHTSSTVFQVASSCVCTHNFVVGVPIRVLLWRVVACEGWLWDDSCGWMVPLPDWSSRLGFSAFTRTARVRFPDREILFVFCSFACLYLNIRIGYSSPLSLPITCLSRKLIIRWTNNTHTLKACGHSHSLTLSLRRFQISSKYLSYLPFAAWLVGRSWRRCALSNLNPD